MSALNISISRKRPHFPGFGDDNSESGDDFPPRKKHRNADLPVIFKTRLQRMTDWFMEIKSLNKFAKMALRCGAATLPASRNPKELIDDSEEDEEDEEDVVECDDDDEIQEIKENFNKERLSPLIKQFGKTNFSSDSGKPKQKLAVNGGCYSLGSHYNSHKLNGATPRDLSTRYHGTTSCNLSRDSTENLKRKPLVSNPASEIEIILGHEPEVITLEGDSVEILSESPSSKQKSANSQKSFHNSVKSSSENASSQQAQSAPLKKSSSVSKFYTANEVVRLQEKAQYKLLLEKYISGSQYRHSQKPESPKKNKEDSSIFSNSHFKKQVLEQPVRNFMEKYYTPCRLLPPKESSEKEETPEITIDDDEDEDDVQVVEMKLPKYKAVFKSRVFSKTWFNELGKNVRNQAEERNKIVEDYERKLENYKKERLLRRLRIEVPGAKSVEPEFPELTPEMQEAVDKVLTTGTPEDFICKTVMNNELLRKDFDTLSGLHWLNDTIINSYFDLIVDRGKKENFPSVYAFNTFFYGSLKRRGYTQVKRWTRKIDIFNFDLNFVPIHLAYHWCLAVIDHRSKKISYYDSMGTSEENCLDILNEYLCLEYKEKKGQLLEPNVYVAETMKEIPQQMNGSDCGMFTLKYAEYISRGAEITFDQAHMQYFRRRTVYEILTNQLL